MVSGRIAIISTFAAVVAAAAIIVAGPAAARTIRVDVGSGQYEQNGQAWEDSETPILAAQLIDGTLPFAIDFGTGDVTGFCLGQDGFVAFSPCSAIDADTVLDVLARDWTSDPTADRIFDEGSVTYTIGQLSPNVVPPGPAPPLADAPRAIRFHWNAVCLSGVCDSNNPDPRYSFQAILIDVDGDAGSDFDLELNYGGPIPAGTGAISFVLGDNVFTFPGDVANEQSFDFRFRNGVLVDGSAVPEPPTLLIAALALLLFAAGRRRIRVR